MEYYFAFCLSILRLREQWIHNTSPPIKNSFPRTPETPTIFNVRSYWLKKKLTTTQQPQHMWVFWKSQHGSMETARIRLGSFLFNIAIGNKQLLNSTSWVKVKILNTSQFQPTLLKVLNDHSKFLGCAQPAVSPVGFASSVFSVPMHFNWGKDTVTCIEVNIQPLKYRCWKSDWSSQKT